MNMDREIQKRTPIKIVKSYLVWNANRVNAITMRRVMPIATMTMKGLV